MVAIATLSELIDDHSVLVFLMSSDDDSISGFLFNGTDIYILEEEQQQRATKDKACVVIKQISSEKNGYCIKMAGSDRPKSTKNISICKSIEDVKVKILTFKLLRASSSENQTPMTKFINLARCIEQSLASCQSALAEQSLQLSDSLAQQHQLMAKYEAAVSERAKAEDSLLDAFAAVLNAKKRRIRELTEASEASDTDESEEPASTMRESRREASEEADESTEIFPQASTKRRPGRPAAAGKGSSATGKGSSATGKGSSATGKGSSATGKGSSATGKGSSATGKGSAGGASPPKRRASLRASASLKKRRSGASDQSDSAMFDDL